MVEGKREPEPNWDDYWQDNRKQVLDDLLGGELEEVRWSSYALLKAIKAGAVEKLDPEIVRGLFERCLDSEDETILTNVIGSMGWVLATQDDKLTSNIVDNEFLTRIAKMGRNNLVSKLSINATITVAVASVRHPKMVADNADCDGLLNEAIRKFERIESTYAGLAFANIAHENATSLKHYSLIFNTTLLHSRAIGDHKLFGAMAFCLRTTIPQLPDDYFERGSLTDLANRLYRFAADGEGNNEQSMNLRALALQALAPICKKWEPHIEDELLGEIRGFTVDCETDNPMMNLARAQVVDGLSRIDEDVMMKTGDSERVTLSELFKSLASRLEAIDHKGITDDFKGVDGALVKQTFNLTNEIKDSPNSSLAVDVMASQDPF